MEFDGRVARVRGTTGIDQACAPRLAEGGATVPARRIDEAASAALAAVGSDCRIDGGLTAGIGVK